MTDDTKSPLSGKDKEKLAEDSVGPVVSEDRPGLHDPDFRALDLDETNALKGDIEPGHFAWVELDEEGNPSGPAHKKMPTDKPAARVMIIAPRVYHEVLTPSGAPITTKMNPDPQMWDEGMLARNPVPGTPQEHKDAGPAGKYTDPPKGAYGESTQQHKHPDPAPPKQSHATPSPTVKEQPSSGHSSPHKK